jgi:hypothetical protein
MRMHTNTLTLEDFHRAMTAEKEAGRIAHHVSFKELSQRGSRSHERAFEVQLTAAYRDRGRRAGNSGSYGAMQPEYDGYAATFDEWGWLLAALYRIDPDLVVGSVKQPIYRNVDNFDERTAWTYNPERWLAYVLDWPTFADERDPFPIVTGQAARTKRGYLIGRRGASRSREIVSYWPHKVQPRTVAEVREFAHLPAEAVTR